MSQTIMHFFFNWIHKNLTTYSCKWRIKLFTKSFKEHRRDTQVGTHEILITQSEACKHTHVQPVDTDPFSEVSQFVDTEFLNASHPWQEKRRDIFTNNTVVDGWLTIWHAITREICHTYLSKYVLARNENAICYWLYVLYSQTRCRLQNWTYRHRQ